MYIYMYDSGTNCSFMKQSTQQTKSVSYIMYTDTHCACMYICTRMWM